MTPADIPESEIVWPKPPDIPRIRFIKSVSKSDDIKISKDSWLRKTWRFISGDVPPADLSAPYGIAADDEGNVYVGDKDTGEIFSFNLRTKKTFSFYYDTESFQSLPIGIAVAKNEIYASYPSGRRIVAFTKSGKPLREIGIGAGLKRPTGIAANPDRGFLYVVDTGSHDVKVFDLKGELLFTFGKGGIGDGEFNYPTHIFTGTDGTVYITDELNFRIQGFSPEGKFLFKFGKIGTVPGTFQSPKGISVDSDGNIYVVEAMADSIQIFNRDGRLLLFFGGSGNTEGRFWSPAGMFIDKHDVIYATDPYNARVQIFQYLREK